MFIFNALKSTLPVHFDYFIFFLNNSCLFKYYLYICISTTLNKIFYKRGNETNVVDGGFAPFYFLIMKTNLFRDHFQNFKSYSIPKAQLIIADIPYNLGNNAYASNPAWYEGGDNKNGESNKANKEFFDTDKDFRPAEFMHFCSKMLRPEPKEKGQAPCMIVFCAFDQQMYLIELAKRYGLNNYINLVFRKNFSAQVLKANMKVVGNCEYGLIFYREKLPKFNNKGKMVMNCIDWERDDISSPLIRKIHPTQKPVKLIERLIEIFSDENDVVIDPCCGSGSTLIACSNKKRKGYGFEIKKDFYNSANEWLKEVMQSNADLEEYGFSKTLIEKNDLTLF